MSKRATTNRFLSSNFKKQIVHNSCLNKNSDFTETSPPYKVVSTEGENETYELNFELINIIILSTNYSRCKERREV